jgi:SAM-dependent methyltransferase
MDAAGWDKRFDVPDYIYTKDVNRFVKELCEPLIEKIGPVGKVIDLAGGEGRNSIWFAEQGWQAENIDFSSTALTKFLAFAEERNVSVNCFANRADATGFESVLTPVDIGVCAYLQIPQSDLQDALDNLIENIRPGGYLVGVWHALDNLDNGFGGPQNPAVLPSAKSMGKFLEQYDLEIEFLGNREGQVQTSEGLKPSITLVLLAKLK